MLKITRKALAATIAGALTLASGAVAAKDLVISAALPQVHFWVGKHMDPFADQVQATTGFKFKRFYAGELVSIGRELDALKGGTIDVAAPLLAPYHEGRFPLSDVSQLPTYGTSSVMATRAFQKLIDSDVKLDGKKTFFQYELGDKGIRGWALGASAPYSLSTTGKELKTPADLKGMPLRAGSALHTIVLQRLGATPVTMPAAQAFEALSRGTIAGIMLTIGDWKSYSLQDILKYTITGVSLGHWESYLAINESLWKGMSEADRKAWDKAAREVAIKNSEGIDAQDVEILELTKAKGAKFVAVDNLSKEMSDHMAKAAYETWVQWIEQLEKKGHPAKAAAKLWASLIKAEGGRLPAGVDAYLAR